MEFFDLVKKRRACHHFLPGKNIPQKDLEKMIEYTSLTPSGYNAQPWEFIIIQERENLKAIQKIAFKQEHLKNASAIVVVLADTFIGRNVDSLLADWLKYGYCTKEELQAYRNSIAKNRNPEKLKSMALRNTMLACMTLMYAAENMGYATCPIMGFSQHELEDYLNIPDDRVVALMIAMGYEDLGKEKERLPRKTIKEMIHWEKFNDVWQKK